jgi:hypothetical protein
MDARRARLRAPEVRLTAEPAHLPQRLPHGRADRLMKPLPSRSSARAGNRRNARLSALLWHR